MRRVKCGSSHISVPLLSLPINGLTADKSKSGCSFGDEAFLRGSVGPLANTPLPSTPAVDPVQVRAPSARYPLAAFMAGREGEGQFLVDVDAQGRTFGANVVRSSGHRDLDRSALEWIRTLRFFPPWPEGCRWPVVSGCR